MMQCGWLSRARAYRQNRAVERQRHGADLAVDLLQLVRLRRGHQHRREKSMCSPPRVSDER